MSFTVSPSSATTPLVLALDVGSTGTRGGLFDATGRPLSQLRHKVHHQFTTATDGTSTIDADQVVAEVAEVITTVCRGLREASGKHRPAIRGVGIDTFASSLVGVDDHGRAITGCITYADSRCSAQVARLRDEWDESAIQQRTGTRIHSSYLPARFAWLAQEHPDLMQRAARWMSLSEYVHLQLIGATAAGTSVAAWTGLLDRRTGDWDDPLLEQCGLERDRLNAVAPPSEPLVPTGNHTDLPSKVWAMVAEAHWSPGISDGFASNVGAGGTDPRSAVIAAATSGAMRVLVDHVPEQVGSGLWCYRVDERRSIVGGALNDVGRAVSWLESTIRMPSAEELAELLGSDPDPDTPLVLPFLSGERSTGWAGGARAVVTGLGAAHDGGALARGMFEGIAASYARVAAQLSEIAGTPERILASGRVSADLPALLPVLADALQAPLTPVTIKRSTLRGTALVTLDVVAPDVARADPTTAPTHEPHPARAEYHRQRLVEFERVYAALIG